MKRVMAEAKEEEEEYFIPLNPNQETIVPWKEGEMKALAKGISERKHRETKEHVWLAKRNMERLLAVFERKRLTQPDFFQEAERQLRERYEKEESKYSPPCQQNVYHLAMEAIRESEGKRMEAVLVKTREQSMHLFRDNNPSAEYTLHFILQELQEKGWPGCVLRFRHSLGDQEEENEIVLCCDFSV